ncbi:hypothetical protein [Bradyrhizobium sp. BR 1433]|uniref:hypothetical protein n=1 Tax=Bradyrhizobium sp. BR 1433 TaxID=3447967 RepID=UPI003EE642D2
MRELLRDRDADTIAPGQGADDFDLAGCVCETGFAAIRPERIPCRQAGGINPLREVICKSFNRCHAPGCIHQRNIAAGAPLP